MEIGQRVKVLKALDKDKEGEITNIFKKSVPMPMLLVGGDDKPQPYVTVKLDDGHINQYPEDWVESV